LWNATLDIARTISGNAPLAIQAAKITIAQVLKDPGDRDMKAIKQIGVACMDSEDFREGPPRLHGKAQAAVSGAITIIMHKPVEASGDADPRTQPTRLPLSRFKVIDLTLARAGPSCVRTLADWGADVIRVEPPPSEGEIQRGGRPARRPRISRTCIATSAPSRST